LLPLKKKKKKKIIEIESPDNNISLD